MKVVVSSGDPAGVGPDLCLLGFEALRELIALEDLLVLADPSLLRQRAQALGLQVPIAVYPDVRCDSLNVIAVPLAVAARAGVADAANSAYVFELLDKGHELAAGGGYALVTNPVNKYLLNQHRPFTGHTEYLQELCGCERVVMLLTAEGREPPLRVALLTTHIGIAHVAAAVQQLDIEQALAILAQQLQSIWGIAAPRIKVAALNPHGGEGGLLGREEIEVIQPAVANVRARGLDVSGPFSADSLFGVDNIAATDAFLAMYHDQGLTVLKHYSFNSAINVTLGLPYLRTSVDHGTAYDIAGSAQVNCDSYLAAVRFAVDYSTRSQI